ncbi:MAG: serine/threonine protein kinase [Pyrinomonadaceae bacterium]
MYCPKCKQSFDEGSRRFCPTDGARLISESLDSRDTGAGIFANLLPKIESNTTFDEELREVSKFREREPELEIPAAPAMNADDDIFFELDEIETEPVRFEPVDQQPEQVSVPVRPTGRKVDPRDIPAGHVDLGGADRMQPYSLDFSEGDPESFVGRIVKGRYKVSEFLGGDETGLAYLADDKIHGDKKVLVRILLADPADEIIGSILAEERVSLSHLSHPNIARLIDSGQFTSGTDFLISEYVDALSVDDVIGIHGEISPQRVARIVRQAASALSEAHQEGILHRDIRPQNLILDASGETEQIKLVNFGASNGEPTPDNAAYKAPEVLEGRIATIASDVFSLAVVAYEMLTGELPFVGSYPKEIVRAQNAGDATLPSDLRPELSPAVDDVLIKAMSYSTIDRYTKARDFGDALFAALAETREPATVSEPQKPAEPVQVKSKPAAAAVSKRAVVVAPAVPVEPRPVSVESPKDMQAAKPAAENATVSEPAWKNRSPEPPAVETSRSRVLALLGILGLVVAIGLGWYYLVNRPETIDVPSQAEYTGGQQNTNISAGVANTEMPPFPRTIPQPPNANFFQNSKQNLRGDLLRNFVGFTMYYPKSWKTNGPKPGGPDDVRGKFIDMARVNDDGMMQEQMLVSYYPSKGTMSADAEKFPELVKETNETLKKLLPGYEMVSQGEIRINGDWRAYEVKFRAGGTTPSGEKLDVWGRRLFMPAARPGVRNGFEITMLATSQSPDVTGVDDVGVRGELASILYSFEPSQNF